MKSILLRCTLVLMLFSCLVVVLPVRADRETQAETEAADADMNKVYKKALVAMPDADAKASLREAQRAWIAFRDAEMKLMQHGSSGGGSDWELHEKDLNTSRTSQLQHLIDMNTSAK